MKVLLKQQIILETWTPYTFISSVCPTCLFCACCMCHGVQWKSEDSFQESCSLCTTCILARKWTLFMLGATNPAHSHLVGPFMHSWRKWTRKTKIIVCWYCQSRKGHLRNPLNLKFISRSLQQRQKFLSIIHLFCFSLLLSLLPCLLFR